MEDLKLSDLASKDWVQELVKTEVEKAIAALAPVVVPPVIVEPPVVVPPVIILPDCKRGPTILSVSVISKVQIQVLFDGDEIFKARITVRDSTGNIVNTPEEFEPVNNHPIVLVKENFKDEKYTVTMAATNCTGKSSYTFNGVTGLPGKPSGEDVVVKPEPCKEIGKITKIELS